MQLGADPLSRDCEFKARIDFAHLCSGEKFDQKKKLWLTNALHDFLLNDIENA